MTSISPEQTPSVLTRLAPIAIALLALSGCGGDDGGPALADDDDGTDGTAPTTSGNTDTTGADPTGADASSSGFVPLCQPDDRRCSDDGASIEVCAGTGLEWELEVECLANSTCRECDDDDDQCAAPFCEGPCQLTENDPSSAGCAFVVNRSLHPFQEFADGLVVTNPNEELTAAIRIVEVPEGVLDEVLVESFNLAPNERRVIDLTTEFVPGTGSNLRTGGIFRVYSDVPVISYQHAPLRANRGNESALLLPDRVLGNDYIVTSYSSLNPSDTSTAFKGASYFELVALHDETRIEWTPRVNTAGNGLPIDPVSAGETGTLVLNRYETIRIVPSELGLGVTFGEDGYTEAFEPLDISGTVIHADNPVWVSGGNRYSRVPLDEPGQGGTGDPLLEVVFPLQHWGRAYVAPSAPIRPWQWDGPEPEWYDFEEASYFRIYAGADDVMISSDPPHSAFPVNLGEVGEFVDIEVDTGVSLLFEADRPFLPVQMVRSKNPISPNPIPGPAQLGYGDAAMVQLVPTEQYLDRYVFATGVDFIYNEVVITRAVDDSSVAVQKQLDPGQEGPNTNQVLLVCAQGDTDALCQTNFEPVGAAYEKALLRLPTEGTYSADSDIPFGIIQFGSTLSQGNGKDGQPLDVSCEAAVAENPWCHSTYAYPGGLKAEAIFIP